jgi:hypothetical protein
MFARASPEAYGQSPKRWSKLKMEANQSPHVEGS